MTGTALISRALRLIGALASGETLPSADGADALVVLNDMLSAWSIEGLLVFTTARQTFTMTANTQAHTIGSSGTFNVARPAVIDRAGIVYNDVETPLEMLTQAQWAAVSYKTQTSTVPTAFWDDNGFPLRTLRFWPIQTGTPTVALYTQTVLTSWATLATDNTLPPGYLRALAYSLAIELAPEYGVNVPPAVAALAAESKGLIKSVNLEPIDLAVDAALTLKGGSGFNIRTGTY